MALYTMARCSRISTWPFSRNGAKMASAFRASPVAGTCPPARSCVSDDQGVRVGQADPHAHSRLAFSASTASTRGYPAMGWAVSARIPISRSAEPNRRSHTSSGTASRCG